MDTFILQKVIFGSAERRCGIISQFFSQSLCKNLCYRIVSMCDKHMLRFRLKCLRPVQKPVYICMAADSGHPADFRCYLHSLTKQFHLCGTFQQSPARCSNCLVSYKKYCISRVPQIVFQMMLDTSCIAHTAGGNNHLAVFVKIDGSGIICSNRCLQTLERQWINPLL